MRADCIAAVTRCLSRIWRSEDGQDLLEYGLLGDTINTVFWQAIANSF